MHVCLCCFFLLLEQTSFIQTHKYTYTWTHDGITYWTSVMHSINTFKNGTVKKEHTTRTTKDKETLAHTVNEEEVYCSLCSGCARQVENESMCLLYLYTNMSVNTQLHTVCFLCTQSQAISRASALLRSMVHCFHFDVEWCACDVNWVDRKLWNAYTLATDTHLAHPCYIYEYVLYDTNTRTSRIAKFRLIDLE